MESVSYYPRICDKVLSRKLQLTGATLIVGPKWCGKTETALQAARSVIYIQSDEQYKEAGKLMPALLLDGETPRLIDEWQEVPELWNAIRHIVDQRKKQGQFILTGSARPRDEVKAHSGIGRFSKIQMRPMTLFESKESTGAISLKSLFDGEQDISAVSSLEIAQLAYVICRGGWPGAVIIEEGGEALVREYTDMLVESDISKLDGIERNPHRIRQVLRSLARNISTLTTANTILEDVRANDLTINERTLDNYLNAMRRLFVVEDVPAWAPSLRSKTTIRTSFKRQLTDPSLATSVLRVDKNGLLHDLNTFGFLFESLCTRDIRVYAQSNDGEVFHYRDKDQLEIDLIVSLNDGRWAAIEVKLGEHQADEAAVNLIRLKNKVNTSRIGEPAFLMVLTGGKFAYKRHDGVMIVPLACLRD